MNKNLEMLRGLYSVYYEVKHNYPNKQKLIDIAWDDQLLSAEKNVENCMSVFEYYMVLMKYISLVDDGHATIMPPWLINPDGFSKPALELTLIDNKIVVSRVGNVKELRSKNISLGSIITHIDDVPVLDVLAKINKIYARGSKHANEKINTYFLLLGDQKKKVYVCFEHSKDVVALTRSIIEDDGNYFIDGFIDFDKPYEIKKLENDIYYCKILSFSSMKIADAIIEVLVNNNPKGIIFDLRLNLGGDDRISAKIISHLIQESVSSPIWRCQLYNQAFQLWGVEQKFEDVQNHIIPASNTTFAREVIVLTSGMTSSTAEDMVIILKEAKRATIVGGRTAGSSGNPKSTKLPFGGTLRVSSFIPLTPSKQEYLGTGIEPDIECFDTVESLREQRDNVLETAIKLFNKN
jgi:C-terminal processing protease CtpA/Prc